MSSTISRRSLTKGAAWSVPVIGAATLVPAFAAASDPCDPIMTTNNTLAYDWASYNTGGAQTLHFSSGVRVSGLPQGVTIAKATVTRWVQQREDGQAGPGLPWPGNSNSSAVSLCSATGCRISYTPQNPGWDPYFTISAKDQSYTNSRGVTFTGWSISTTFDGTVSGVGILTESSAECPTFATRPSGNSGFDAPLVARYTRNPRTTNQSLLRARTEEVITVQLSNGQVLTKKTPSLIDYNSNG